MEAIRSIQSTPQVSRIQDRARRPENEQRPQETRPDAAYYEPRLSDSAKLFNAIEQSGFMNDEDIYTLREDLRKAVEKGEFNAESLAETAPDAVRALADERNINLREAMAGIAGSYSRPAYDAAAATAPPAPAPEEQDMTPDTTAENEPAHLRPEQIERNMLREQQEYDRQEERVAENGSAEQRQTQAAEDDRRAVEDTQNDETPSSSSSRDTMTQQIMDRIARNQARIAAEDNSTRSESA